MADEYGVCVLGLRAVGDPDKVGNEGRRGCDFGFELGLGLGIEIEARHMWRTTKCRAHVQYLVIPCNYMYCNHTLCRTLHL